MDPGEQLRERRLKLGLTQIALAEAVGCDEAGERTPTLRIALQLEQAIGVKASCWVAVA
jgi:transcriptional regulator with XRE-family HTH domain